MDKAQAKIRIAKLREEINHHRYLYHVLDSPEISDGALDSLKHELERLENKYGNNPYGDYDNINNQPMRFFQDSVDARLPAMTRIVEISVEQKHRIYPFPAIP